MDGVYCLVGAIALFIVSLVCAAVGEKTAAITCVACCVVLFCLAFEFKRIS